MSLCSRASPLTQLLNLLFPSSVDGIGAVSKSSAQKTRNFIAHSGTSSRGAPFHVYSHLRYFLGQF